MAYIKKESSSNSAVKDYKARFEFVLTTTNAQTGEENIICQRYFKIGDFNALCARSSRLKDAIVRCAKIINKDLIEKSAIYTSLMAPRVFKTVAEMEEYFSNPAHADEMTLGEGIVVEEANVPNYVWSKNGPKVSPTKFNKFEFAHASVDEDATTFTLAFKDTGRVVASYSWTSILPKAVKSSIDLSNKAGRVAPEEVNTLNGEAWVLYKMTEGRVDLVWKIIKEICSECCVKEDEYYTEADPFGEEAFIQSAIAY